MRVADHRGHEGATRALARRGHGELRRRSRRRRGGPQRLRGAGRARDGSTSTTTTCRSCSISRPRPPTARTWCTPISAPTSARSGRSTPRRPARVATSKRPSATPKCSCSAPSGSSGSSRRSWSRARWWSTRPARSSPMWSATQIPHILRLMLAMTLEIPEHKVRVIAPDVGGGFGGKLQVTPEEVIALLVARTARQAGQVHRVPQRVHARGTPRPRPDPEADARRPPRRHRHRPEGASCSPTWAPTCGLVTPVVPILGAFMFNGIYKFPSYHFTCTNVLHQQVNTLVP